MNLVRVITRNYMSVIENFVYFISDKFGGRNLYLLLITLLNLPIR